ncbi:MAG: HD domain-containing protein [Methanocellales archaeon]
MKMQDLIDFFLRAMKLKEINRMGWVRVGVEEPESVAEHSFFLVLLAMVLGKKFNLNCEKLMKMAILHDLGEIETGDITPYDDKAEEKRLQERRSTEALLLLLSDVEFLDIWMEYQSLASQEALFLKQLDKLEMAFQALIYEEIYSNLNFESFWDTARAEVKIPELAELLKAIEARRQLRR